MKLSKILHKYNKKTDKFIKHHTFPVNKTLSPKEKTRFARLCCRRFAGFKFLIELNSNTSAETSFYYEYMSCKEEVLFYHKRRIIAVDIDGTFSYLIV